MLFLFLSSRATHPAVPCALIAAAARCAAKSPREKSDMPLFAERTTAMLRSLCR